jgi:hypothetical protein
MALTPVALGKVLRALDEGWADPAGVGGFLDRDDRFLDEVDDMCRQVPRRCSTGCAPLRSASGSRWTGGREVTLASEVGSASARPQGCDICRFPYAYRRDR